MTSLPSSASLKRSLASAAREYHEQLLTDPEGLAYLAERGLGSSPAIEALRFGVVRSPRPEHEMMAGRLVIPFIGPAGNVYDLRFRCIEDHDHKDSEVKCPKYLGSDGVETRMYNVRALLAPTDYILVTEGEMDAATLTACGWPAVGIPGANAWKPHFGRMLSGFSRVILLADADEAGKKLAAKFRKALPSSGRVIVCKHEDARDVNEVYVRYGKDALAALLRGEDDE